MYQSGRGVPPDAVRALRLFLSAAENGNMTAAINLAKTFHRGIGVKPDPEFLACGSRLCQALAGIWVNLFTRRALKSATTSLARRVNKPGNG
jgi:TPR repeat protein